ncbi:hypothetical protein F3Y22_tig00110383pilonHSYRG00175 [Hibiscus syriacus]|uniref:Uncharacterized protein n=1 Tax=Hibiscus syriacus TaxID=106335 RepID=A0A6A3ASB5_HIBSY|nr:hypothetical protein F3Y22_tig00110383pilonHSYRG00175 [Hibiscus syriacus]
MEEVNATLVELEENEHIVSTDKTSNEKHSDTEKPFSRTTSYSVSADLPSILNGSEENGGMHEEIGDGDSISESGSKTIEQEGHNENDLDEENHDDGCDIDEDDEVHVSKDNHRRVVSGESGDEVLDEEAGGSQEVQVKVLVKRWNKQQTKQMVEEENNGLGAQTLNWPSVNSRAYGHGNSWEGSNNRSGGSRHCHHSHSGSRMIENNIGLSSHEQPDG